MEIGDALRRFRHEFNLTQKQVTEKIGITVPQQWQKYEYKQMIPSAEIIAKLATAFDVSADYLLGLTDEVRPVPVKVSEDEIQKALALYNMVKSIK